MRAERAKDSKHYPGICYTDKRIMETNNGEEAAVYCFLNNDNYRDTVLQVVNLGEDMDTTACVAGGLAGLYYGPDSIPEDWLAVLAKRKRVAALAKKFCAGSGMELL